MKKSTTFTHLGRPKAGLGTAVNPSITRASTLLFEKAEDLYRTDIRGYGRHGAQVHDNLADMFTALEGGHGSVLFPSGLAACTYPILATVKAGDHILLTDSAYGPVRSFCLNHLAKMNIETQTYDPRIGGGIADLIRENTSMIIMESPGSLTLEIQDVPAIVKVAKAKNVTTMLDNTWSAGLVYNAIAAGVDYSVHAATKYFGGHSDVLFGAAICGDKAHHETLVKTAKYLGNSSSPDDAYDEHYFKVHSPLMEKLPGYDRIEVSRVTRNMLGDKYYLMFEMWFSDKDAFKNALRSKENRGAGKDLMGFAGEIVSVFTAEVVE